MNNANLAAGMTIAALWQVAGRFFPLAEPHKPPTVTRRITAYTWGCVGILGGIAVATDRRIAEKAAAVTVAAGAATVAVYAIDRLLNLWMRHRAYGCHG